MCLPKPGPRCSYHAHKLYASAKSALAQNSDPSKVAALSRKVEETEWEYQTTPRGQNELRRKAMFAETPEETARYEKMLNEAVAFRESQLVAYRAVKLRESQGFAATKQNSDMLRSQKRGTIALAAYLEWFGEDADLKLTTDDTLQSRQGKFLILGMKHTSRNIPLPHVTASTINTDTWEYPTTEEEADQYWNSFAQKHINQGYVGIALTHLISDEVWFLDWEAAKKALNVRYRLRPKPSGTNPWANNLASLEEAIADTPMAHLSFSPDETHVFVSEFTPPLPKSLLTAGRLSLRAVSKNETGEVQYAPRRRSAPSTRHTLSIELTAKDETYGSGVSKKFQTETRQAVTKPTAEPTSDTTPELTTEPSPTPWSPPDLALPPKLAVN